MQEAFQIAGVIFVLGLLFIIAAGTKRAVDEHQRNALHDSAARTLAGGIHNNTSVHVNSAPVAAGYDAEKPWASPEPDTNILAAIPPHVKACAVGAMNGTLPDSSDFYRWFSDTEANFMPSVLKAIPTTNRMDVRAALYRFAQGNVGLHMDAVLARETKK